MSAVQSGDAGKVRVADYVMDVLVEHGIRHVFMVAGGGAMYLNDAAGSHPGLDVVCFLHEQAAAIAAEAYRKVSGNMALCLVTAGPGGTNAVTGVAGGWLDSTPMLVLSGQVKRSDLVGTSGVRQRGVQELDLSTVVSSITKEAVMVMEPARIRYQLERALHLAEAGRPGPVWLELPLDVQGAFVEAERLVPFDVDEVPSGSELAPTELAETAGEIATLVRQSRRPLLLIGAGARLARCEEQLLDLVRCLGVPVLTTWPAMGVVGNDHPLFVGRPGSLAQRGANFALQNADLLLCIGARLDMVTTGYDPKDFGRNAQKIVIDIDPHELAKLDGAIALPVCADAGDFVGALRLAIASRPVDVDPSWLARCRAWRDDYPLVTDDHRRSGQWISTYHLADVLSDLLADDDVLAPCSSGLAIEIFLLALRLRTGHRATFTTGLGAMGYGPPAAIGACIGSGGRRTICVDGDGGLQLNVQELETIRRLGLPIKVLVLSNDGYASIRASQQRWFGRLSGADESSGVSLPPLQRLAAAYSLPYVKIDGMSPLGPQLRKVLDTAGPVICEIPTPPSEPREPVQVSEALPDGGMRSRPIEDLFPLLDRAELLANLVSEPSTGPVEG